MRQMSSSVMADPNGYATIKARETARQSARVTKAKLGITWSEFLVEAAYVLDPDRD